MYKTPLADLLQRFRSRCNVNGDQYEQMKENQTCVCVCVCMWLVCVCNSACMRVGVRVCT